ncbi:MAG TPA: NAD(+) kinase [Phycisphaerales bacterium]|nr:NAD(+) kinase [Phycisphaerales bacterium]
MTDCKTAIMKARTVPGSDQLVAQVRAIAERHGTVVADLVSEETIPSDLDRLIVIGGDGTIIGAARQALEHGTPILGVNAGRLGILADFDVESLARHAEMIFGAAPLVREHLVLNIRIIDARGDARFESVAINDCVVTAGPPYRMIELSLMIDDTDGPSINGDGLIISTPIGSTAYNVSAGGPIIQPNVDALVISAVAPHSLAFRPIVAASDTRIQIGVKRGNRGTSLVLDGQATHSFSEGEHLVVESHRKRTQLIGNPESSYWNTLIEKMRWGAPPTYRDRGT